MHLQKKIIKNRRLTDKYVIPILIIFMLDGAIALSTGFVSAVASPTALIQQWTFRKNAIVPFSSPAPSPIDISLYPSPAPSPVPTTVKPLTFTQMEAAYGPCVRLPVLTYHHVEDFPLSLAKRRTGLAVTPINFQKQLSYLVERGYKTVLPDVVNNFFNNGTPVLSKSVMLTFDDGYIDFYTNVYPLLKKLNLKAVLFLPTGLTGNSDYVNWGEVVEMANSGQVYIANHTWSHSQMSATSTNDVFEITTADNELSQRSLNTLKVFAYPYGTTSSSAISVLQTLSYTQAYTTRNGQVLCKQQRLTLPRVRIGNRELKAYGF